MFQETWFGCGQQLGSICFLLELHLGGKASSYPAVSVAASPQECCLSLWPKTPTSKDLYFDKMTVSGTVS